VNDYAHVIDGASALEIARIAQRVEAASGGEIVLVTLRSTQGRSALEVAEEFARVWELWGAAEEEPSVLVLLTLEGDVQAVSSAATAEFADGVRIGRIVNRRVIPAMEQREFGAGALALVRGLEELYAEYFRFE
jgi:uncharacterized membrane protein YgcG